MKRCAGKELARGDGIQCIDAPDLTGMARRCYTLRSWLHWNNYCEHEYRNDFSQCRSPLLRLFATTSVTYLAKPLAYFY